MTNPKLKVVQIKLKLPSTKVLWTLSKSVKLKSCSVRCEGLCYTCRIACREIYVIKLRWVCLCVSYNVIHLHLEKCVTVIRLTTMFGTV